MIARRRELSAYARHTQKVQLHLQELAAMARRSRRSVRPADSLKETVTAFSCERTAPAESEPEADPEPDADAIELAPKLSQRDTDKIPLSSIDTRSDLQLPAISPSVSPPKSAATH